MDQVNGSIARYLRALDQADREESDIAEAKSVRLKEKIPSVLDRGSRKTHCWREPYSNSRSPKTDGVRRHHRLVCSATFLRCCGRSRLEAARRVCKVQ